MRCLTMLLCAPCVSALAQNPPGWGAKSKQNGQLRIDMEARSSPVGAASNGVRGLDEQITVPAPENRERALGDYRAAKKELESRLASEQDPLIKQDLEILIHAADLDVRRAEASYSHLLPVLNPSAVIY